MCCLAPNHYLHSICKQDTTSKTSWLTTFFFFLPHKCIHKEYTLLMLYDLYSLNAVNLCHFYCATADIVLWCTNWSLWAFLVFNKFSGWGKSRQTFVMLNKFSHLGCMLQSFTCCQIKAKIISVSTLDRFPFINVGFFSTPYRRGGLHSCGFKVSSNGMGVHEMAGNVSGP